VPEVDERHDVRTERHLEVLIVQRLAFAAHALIDLVRLRSGELQDDISIVLCREAA
jgi:hypothetical protein